MQLINQYAEYYGETPNTLNGTIRRIERAGRLCYNSQCSTNIEDSEKFVNKLISNGHLSVLEHSNLVTNKCKCVNGRFLHRQGGITSGNIRAWMEFMGRSDTPIRDFWMLWNDVYGPSVQTTDPLHTRISALFVTDRAVTHELVRHRDDVAYSQQSQRYVSYKDAPIDMIRQWWCDENEVEWIQALQHSADTYRLLIKNGCTPQQARSVLPNATATKIMVTTNTIEWAHIFKLRCSNAAYPQIHNLLKPIQQSLAVCGCLTLTHEAR